MRGCYRVLSFFFLLLIWINAAGAQNSRASGGDFSKATQPLTKVPSGVILVKGAWSASSDSTAVPERGLVSGGVYKNEYFGLSYPLPNGWGEEFEGPPPSDSGRYVLAQLQAATGATRAQLLVSAQDMFFSNAPVDNAFQLASYEKDNLQPDYKAELPVTQTKIAGEPFSFFAYWSPVAQLHWYVLGTEIRCHTLEFVFTSHDTKLLQSLVLQLNKMSLPAAATGFPVCIKDYAETRQLIRRVDPIFTEHWFNPVPVRIIIDAHGMVKHIHFLSAFPDQQKAITDALKQWKFKPYLDRGKVVEVETGVMFGRTTSGRSVRAGAAVD